MEVAIYVRLSDEDKDKLNKIDESKSIQNQKSMLLQYAMERGWGVYQIYSDDDYTGADRDRPAFKQMLADAEKRKFDIILCKSQSRFTRELELVEKYIHGLFLLWNIRFVGMVDHADTEVAGNKKARQINGLVNEWYLEDLSASVTSTIVDKQNKGLHTGAFALYGYRKDPEKPGHLVVDPEAAKVVKMIFSLFVQGYGKAEITRILNERGIPNPTEYKRLCGLRYRQPEKSRGKLWNYQAVSNLLKNEMYIGYMVQGKVKKISYKSKKTKAVPRENWRKSKEPVHEAIIDARLWEQAQEKQRLGAKPFGSGMIGLLAQKVVCKNCGYIMCSTQSHGLRYLKCATRIRAPQACAGAFAPVREIEEAALAELRRLMELYLDKGKLLEETRIRNNLQEKIDALTGEIVAYEKKYEEHGKAIRNLYLDKAKGILSEDDFIDFSGEFTEEKERIGIRLKDLKEHRDALEEKKRTTRTREQIIENHVDVKELNREIVEKFIDCIYVGKRNPETKELPIEIHWNF